VSSGINRASTLLPAILNTASLEWPQQRDNSEGRGILNCELLDESLRFLIAQELATTSVGDTLATMTDHRCIAILLQHFKDQHVAGPNSLSNDFPDCQSVSSQPRHATPTSRRYEIAS
jgi:hypothetical protein